MSHELRSPLNAILGFAQLINSDSPPPTSSQAASIDQILHAGWYLLDLIKTKFWIWRKSNPGSWRCRGNRHLSPTSMLECQAMIEPQAAEAWHPNDVSPSGMSYFVDADVPA